MSRSTAVIVVAGMFIAILLGALDQFVVLTALPNIALHLGAPAQASFVVSAYLITATIGIPIFGRLADIYSRRSVFLVGVGTFLGGSILSGFSQTMTQLIAFRALQGFSSGAFIVVGFAIVAVLFPPEVRTRLAGLFSGSFVIATIVGPLLGSAIVDHFDWRWVFFVNLPVGGFAASLLALRLTSLTPAAGPRFDTTGAALLSGWVASLMLAVVQTSTGGWSWTDARVLGLIAAAVALLVTFVAWELRTSSPLLPLRQFSNRVFAASGAVAFFRGAVLSAELAFIAVYVGLVVLRGQTGAADQVRDLLYWLLIPGVLGAAVGSQLLNRLPYRPLTVFGLGLGLAGTVLLALASASKVIWQFEYGFLPTGGLAASLPLIGLGVGLTIPVTILSAQFSMRNDEAGSATAVVQFLGALGGAMAISLLTSFQQWRFAVSAPSSVTGCGGPAVSLSNCAGYGMAVQSALVASFQATFAAIAALMAVGFVAALFLRGRVPLAPAAAAL